MPVRVVERRDRQRLGPPVGRQHQRAADRRPQAGGPEQPPPPRVRHGAQVEQVADELGEGSLDLGLPQLVDVLDALGLEADGVGAPVEGGSGAAGDGARVAREGPVLGAVLEAVEGHDGVAGQLDLDDAVDDVAAGERGEAAAAEEAPDAGERGERRERVVEDGEDCLSFNDSSLLL